MSAGRPWGFALALAALPWLMVRTQTPVSGPAIDPSVIAQGAHRVHVLDTSKHVAYACTTCHERGATAVTLAGWDPAVKSCSTSYCHGRFTGGTGAAARWEASTAGGLTCSACHAYPPPTAAHRTHAATDRYAISCFVCHGGRDWVQRHTAGSVQVAFDARAGAGARYAPPTCSDVACHSNGLGTAHDVRWAGSPLSCASCHDDDTSAAPRMSGQHARHFRIGVGCADCHGAVVDRDKRIINYSLHANGRADVKVLAGRYSAGSCQPACHDARAW